MSSYKDSAKAMASAKLSRIAHGHTGGESADGSGDSYGTKRAGESDSSCFKRGGAVMDGKMAKGRLDRPVRGKPFGGPKKAMKEDAAVTKSAAVKQDDIGSSIKDAEPEERSEKPSGMKKRAAGGAVDDESSGMKDDPDKSGDATPKGGKREAYKHGGAVKKGTTVNIVVQSPGGADQAQPMPMPIAVGGPPAAPPMPMQRPMPAPPSMGAPPTGAGPMGGPPMGGPGPMPMRKQGGRVAMTDGAESGEGRLEKTRIAKAERLGQRGI